MPIPTVSKTHTEAADQITRGMDADFGGGLKRIDYWNGGYGQQLNFTYGFRDKAPNGSTTFDYYVKNEANQEIMGGFKHFTAAQISATELALSFWDDLADINFTRVNTLGSKNDSYADRDDAELLFGNFTSGPAVSFSGGWGGTPFTGKYPTAIRESLVWIDGTEADLLAPTVGQRSGFLYVHEIGHALGLLHPDNYNVAPGLSITYANAAKYIEDTYQYTVMSYFNETSNPDAGADFGGLRPMTPMLHDIAAIQKLYGANMNTRNTDTVYGFHASGIDADVLGIYGMTKSTDKRVLSIWDAGGEDTLDFSKYTSGSTIDLREGEFSSVGGLKKNISIAFGAIIENGIGGSGNDTILGNEEDNELTGNGGNDTLLGDAGNDKLDGGTGNDLLLGGKDDDELIGGAGIDTASYAFSDFAVTVDLATQGVGQDTVGDGKDTLSEIENLTGSAHNDLLTGDDFANRIDGGAGDDQIEGGLGNDILIGGTHGGNGDFLSYSNAQSGVTVSLALTGAQDTKGAGKDTISLFENLAGSAHADKLTGDKNRNEILGGANDDLIDGGLGDDVLLGQNGDDTLIGGLGDDFLSGGGNGPLGDTASYAGLNAAVTVDLFANDGLTEQDTVGGGKDTFLDIENATGGNGADKLTGNNSANILDGGTGNDTLIGNDDNDTLIGGAGADALNGGDGSDTASYETSKSGVTVVLDGVTLGKGGDAAGDTLTLIERLIGSAKDDKLTGNGDANTLHGGGGNDTLDGGGGKDEIFGGDGNDTLLGGPGADNYDGGTGINTITFAGLMTYTYVDLNAGKGYSDDSADDTYVNIQNVTGGDGGGLLVGTDGSNILIGGNGNELLVGNPNFVAANDKLFGLGGDDTMYGFVGDTLDGGTGIDTLLVASLVFGTVTIDLAKNTYGSGKSVSKIAGFENVMGDIAQNVIIGNALVNRLLGEDSADVIEGGAGADTLDGGSDFDTVAYTTSNAGVTIDLTKQGTKADNNDAPEQSGGHAQGDKLYRFENVTGSKFNDIITGDGGDNVIEGGLGNDILEGGANTAPGDTVSFASATGAITFDLSKQSDTVAVNTGAGLDKISGFENAFGGKGADKLTGDSFSNTIDGREGNDTIEGGGAADRLFGGLGIDTVSYAASGAGVAILLEDQGQFDIFGNVLDGTKQNGGDAEDDLLWGFENVIGSDHNDTLIGDGSANALSGGKGGDIISGLGGNDVLDGGADFDTADYSYLAVSQNVTVTLGTFAAATGASALTKTSGVAGDLDSIKNFEAVWGGAGNDVLTGNAGGNNLIGNFGEDKLSGLGGIDILSGGDSNDWIEGGDGADQIDGGFHSDTASYAASTAGVTIHLLNDTASGGHADGDELDNIENLVGSAKNDKLTGDGNDNTIEGGLGDDELNGGVAGNDTVSFASSKAAITLDLTLQHAANAIKTGAGNDIVFGFENIIGGLGADRLTGDVGANVIDGGNGNDIIDGGDNNDTLSGGTGNDTLNGGDGDDKLFGGDGNDTLNGGSGQNEFTGGAGADIIIGNPGQGDIAYISGTEGLGDVYDLGATFGDTLEFKGTGPVTLSKFNATTSGIDNINGYGEAIIGTAAADVLNFSGLFDMNAVSKIDGLGGNDTIIGSVEADNIYGAAGNDTLSGGDENDHLYGGLGVDTLTGGADADTFHIKLGEGADTVTDFLSGPDHIVFDLGSVTSAVFVTGSGSGVPAHAGPGAAIIYDQDDGKIYFDSGPGSPVLLATLTGAPAFLQSDFNVLM